MTSPDGITWTGRYAAQANSWRSVTFGNGLFVAVSSNAASGNTRAMTSPDGIIWTSRTTPSQVSSLYSVTYGNGLFVAITVSKVVASADGITWTAGTAISGAWKSVTSGKGIFVAVASFSSQVMTWGPF